MERARTGLTQRQLAARVGISLSSLSEIERGERVNQPSRAVAEKLDAALDAEGRLFKVAGYRAEPAEPDPTRPSRDEQLREIVRHLFRELRELLEE